MDIQRSGRPLRHWSAAPAAAVCAVLAATGATLLQLWILGVYSSGGGAGLPVVAILAVLGLYGAGMLIIGLPVWAALHGLGLREPWHAAAGGVSATAAGVLLVVLLLTGKIVTGFTSELIQFGLIPGALGGWALQAVAYAPRPRA